MYKVTHTQTPSTSTFLVQLKFDTFKDFRHFFTHDISKGGLFIIADKPKPVGAKVELVLLPPGNIGDITINGVVIRTITAAQATVQQCHPGMGIRFVDLSDQIQAKLDEIIGELIREQRELEALSIAPIAPKEIPERREHPRFQNPFTINLTIPRVEHFRKFVTDDIGRGEMFMNTKIPAYEGQMVNVLVRLPLMDKKISFPAEVVHIVSDEVANLSGGKAGIRIRFVGMDQNKKLFLQDLVHKLERRSRLDNQPHYPLENDAPSGDATTYTCAEGSGDGAILDSITMGMGIRIAFKALEDFKKLYHRDLVQGAIFITTEQPLPIMSLVKLRFAFPGFQEEIALQGEVLRSVSASGRPGDQAGMLLRLVDLSEEKKVLIEKLLQSIDRAAPPSPKQEPPLPQRQKGPAETDEPEKITKWELAQIPRESSAPISPQELAEELNRLEKVLDEDYYKALGVHQSSTEEVIQKSFYNIVELLRPDKYSHSVSADILYRLEQVQENLLQARNTLIDETSRAAYDVLILKKDLQARERKEAEKSEPRPQAPARENTDKVAAQVTKNTNKAEMLINTAMKAVEQGNFQSALANVKLALAYDPENESYKQLMNSLSEQITG